MCLPFEISRNCMGETVKRLLEIGNLLFDGRQYLDNRRVFQLLSEVCLLRLQKIKQGMCE